MLLLSWALAMTLSASADVTDLSPKCAEMAGDFPVEFHGQIFPFKKRIYHLRLTFLEGSSGVIIQTDYNYLKPTRNFETDTLLNTRRDEWSLTGLNVSDCYNQPYECLRAGATSLKHLVVARTYPSTPATPDAKRAVLCAIERVRLFNKTVRTEVLQPTLRALPRF